MGKGTEFKLGQLLVKKRLVTLRQVRECLEIQRKLRDRGEQSLLGPILVERGYIDGESLKECLSQMGVLVLSCHSCHMDYRISNYRRDREYKCPRCQGDLTLTGRVRSSQGGTAPSLGVLPSGLEDLEHRNLGVEFSDDPRGSEKDSGCDTLINRIIGGCQIIERIGRGGMGVVYKAKQLNLGRIVALKILAEDLAQDKSFVRRFIHEARAAGGLNHGSIVHVNDVGQMDGIFYLNMEYVDGANLREILFAHGTIDPARALEIVIQVAHALKHAHRRNIIHRDIKPENIMITRDGAVKLADLGLAKRIQPGEDGGLTHSGSVMGTPFYMAPEQAKDFSRVDRRSDLYSLGVTLYRMLTGQVPFDGRSPVEVMMRVVEGKKVPVRDLRPDVPEGVEEIVDRMTHRDPEMRYQDADTLLKDLTAVLQRIREAAPA